MSKAETVSRIRSASIGLLALLLLASQLAPSTYPNEAGALPLLAWVLLCCILLLHITPLGTLIWRRTIRSSLEDEGTAHNRALAHGTGFWLALATCLAMFTVPMLRELPAREAIRIVASIAIAAAAIRFSLAEMRALYG